MRICHMTSVHSVTDLRILHKECVSLKKAGYDVHLIGPGIQDAIVNGIKIHAINNTKMNRLYRMTKTVSKVYRMALDLNADIYHFHDPELIPVALKIKKKGKKVIYDVHEDVPRQLLTKNWLPEYMKPIVSRSFENFENYSAEKFDLIVAATPHIENRFKSQGANAINVSNYPIYNPQNVPSIDSSNRKNQVCYVGGIIKPRGIFEMLDAIHKIGDVVLSLAGNFSVLDERKKALEYPGWDRVQYHGYVSQEEIQMIYQDSFAGLVLLHPIDSYVRSLPVKMFEYMSAGLPVVASNFTPWKSIIEGTKSGICVDPLNTQEIVQAIRYLRDNKEEAIKMGINGRLAIKEKYNWSKEEKKLLSAYENI